MEKTNKKAATIDRINQAIHEVIIEKGIVNISIKEITTRAQVSIGTFYLYYTSIDDIIYKRFRLETLQHQALIEQALTYQDVIEELKLVLVHQLDFFQYDKTEGLAQSLSVLLRKPVKAFLLQQNPYYHCLFTLIDYGKQQGLIQNPKSATLLTIYILQSSFGACCSYIASQGDEAVKVHFIEMIFAYLDIQPCTTMVTIS